MTQTPNLDPVENALHVWRENLCELPAHVNAQLDSIIENNTGPGSMVSMSAQELGDVIGQAFRAGWDHGEMYLQNSQTETAPTRTRQIVVRLTDEEWKTIEDNRNNLNRSDFIRNAIFEKKHPPKILHVFYPEFNTKTCQRCGLTMSKGNHYH
jgi:hypothetical protein